MTGTDLKELRDRRGWTQQELADNLNAALGRRYGSATVSQWELGKRSVPAHVSAFLDELQVAEALPLPAPDPDAGDGAASGGSERPQDVPPGGGAALPPPQPVLGVSGAYTRVCEELWEMLGTLVATMGAVAGSDTIVRDGQMIAGDKVALGRAWGKLAETNVTFRRWLTSATTSGAWVEVGIVTAGTAGKLLQNHLAAREEAHALGPREADGGPAFSAVA